MQAEVIIEYPVKSLDKSFNYIVPKKMQEIIKIGMKVKVPFGSKILNGIVINLLENENKDLKSIYSIENEEIYLNDEQLKIGKFLKEETLCTLITAYQTMLPSALKIKNQKTDYNLYDTYVCINEDENVLERYFGMHPKAYKQKEIIDNLRFNKILRKEINSSLLKSLIDNNLVYLEKEKKYRLNNMIKDQSKPILTDKQNIAYKEINKYLDRSEVVLLQGVTGSGKTEVYMQLIEDVVKNNKTALVLVPEISLTTQTVNRFYHRFGHNVAIFHSGLSNGEKYDEYMKIYNKEVSIVVGTRSSIFVPLENIGIIIIDEEHSETYKQSTNPRYDALEVAKFRSRYHNCPLLLASATPSLESRARSDKNVYHLVRLDERINKMPLPKTILIDMKNNKNIYFSDDLIEKMQVCLDKNEQIILFLNRRGYSTFITCQNCGFTHKCPNCDITLTYHKSTNNLRCHYCGYMIKNDIKCPNCHENSLKFLGMGTQKIEEELYKIFPEARVIRMDQDTTTKKGSYQRIIDDFGNNKYDILLGTQMISKGLDFKNVTLVGIINADYSLNIPDFRSNEKTFDLLYQTAGRCGRDKKRGEVVIQTYNPDNAILKFVVDNNYDKFYNYEMNIRHTLKYPPYTYIAILNIKGSDYNLLSNEANLVFNTLKNNIDKSSLIYGPTPAPIFKINNIYDFQIIIKYTFDNKLKSALKDIDTMYMQNKKINIEISFNPSHF